MNGLDLRSGDPELYHISLCTGAGGIDLGLKLLFGERIRTVAYCERESHAAATLVARMEEAALDRAPIWDDVRTFNCRPYRGRVHLLTAGYPCQPFSHAGKRAGGTDPRHLWPHVRRIIVQLRPVLVLLENVSGHLSLGFDTVRAELQKLGYRVKADLFTAEEIGFTHKRERLFALAYAESGSRPVHQGQGREGRGASEPHRAGAQLAEPEGRGCGELRESERTGIRAGQPDGCGEDLADACCAGLSDPEHRAVPGEGRRGEGGAAGELCGAPLADPDGKRLGERHAGESHSDCWWDAEADPLGILPIAPPGPLDADGWARVLAEVPEVEPALCRMAYGMADRVDRLRLTGNGVVPLVAAVAFVSLWLKLGEGD